MRLGTAEGERHDQSLSELRNRVLQPAQPWPEVVLETAGTAAGGPPEGLVREVQQRAGSHGVAAVQLERPLDLGEFIAFGRALGPLLPETDPAVQTRVRAGVVLDLLVERRRADDVRHKPFTAEALTLHTESSRRPARHRPRWLVMQCLVPPATPSEGQTVVVSMSDVADRLPRTTLDELAAMPSAAGDDTVYDAASRSFAFRDDGSDEQPSEALTSLVRSLYTSPVRAVPWRVSVLVLLDNSRVFHGRTWSRVAGPRHLQRLRVLAGADGGDA